MSTKEHKATTHDSYGVFTEPGTIFFKRLFPGPIERVWAYLTEPEKRGQWLAAGDMELKVGGKVELIFNHKNLTTHDDPAPEKYKEYEGESRMQGKITRLNPPRLLSYTWTEASGESEVTFELTPKGEKVLLELTHRHLGDDKEILLSIGAGWHTHLGIMEDKLNGDIPKPFWSVHMELEKEYEKRV